MQLLKLSVITATLAALQLAAALPTDSGHIAESTLEKRQCGGGIVICNGVAKCCPTNEVSRLYSKTASFVKVTNYEYSAPPIAVESKTSTKTHHGRLRRDHRDFY